MGYRKPKILISTHTSENRLWTKKMRVMRNLCNIGLTISAK